LNQNTDKKRENLLLKKDKRFQMNTWIRKKRKSKSNKKNWKIFKKKLMNVWQIWLNKI